jgi:hypothetical protein
MKRPVGLVIIDIVLKDYPAPWIPEYIIFNHGAF